MILLVLSFNPQWYAPHGKIKTLKMKKRGVNK